MSGLDSFINLKSRKKIQELMEGLLLCEPTKLLRSLNHQHVQVPENGGLPEPYFRLFLGVGFQLHKP